MRQVYTKPCRNFKSQNHKKLPLLLQELPVAYIPVANKVPTMKYLMIVCVLLQCGASHGFLAASPWTIMTTPSSSKTCPCNMVMTTSMKDDTQKLLERASQLRQEADAMERQLRAERGDRPVAMANIPEPKVPAMKYQSLPDSMWEITYRFATEPVQDREDQDEPIEYFRGTLNLKLRSDGFTDILSQDNDSLSVVKVWGWDEELAQEDDKRYLLFSIDTKIGQQSKQRFYFQAELVQDSRTSIALKEGTVTIKQDLAEKQKMMGFGFFSAKGILAQFRYVGNFSAKPIKME